MNLLFEMTNLGLRNICQEFHTGWRAKKEGKDLSSPLPPNESKAVERLCNMTA